MWNLSTISKINSPKCFVLFLKTVALFEIKCVAGDICINRTISSTSPAGAHMNLPQPQTQIPHNSSNEAALRPPFSTRVWVLHSQWPTHTAPGLKMPLDRSKSCACVKAPKNNELHWNVLHVLDYHILSKHFTSNYYMTCNGGTSAVEMSILITGA